MQGRQRAIAFTAVGVAALVALLYWVLTTPSDTFMVLPEREALVADEVMKVEGERTSQGDGDLLYLAVLFHRASIAESWLARFAGGTDLRDLAEVVPPGGDREDDRRISAVSIDQSKDVAAAVALNALGDDIAIEPDGVVVTAVGSDKAHDAGVRPGMVIVETDGKPTLTLDQLRDVLAAHEPGDTVAVVARDGDQRKTFQVELVPDPDDAQRALIGIAGEERVTVGELPVDIDYTTGGLGGPSAGLAFALEIYDARTDRSLTKSGLRTAITGTISPDGSVGPIGGMKQKAIGAREAGAELLVVPDANAEEAREWAGDLPVVAVSTFDEALAAIKAHQPS